MYFFTSSTQESSFGEESALKLVFPQKYQSIELSCVLDTETDYLVLFLEFSAGELPVPLCRSALQAPIAAESHSCSKNSCDDRVICF
jgi:hypothetical protein